MKRLGKKKRAGTVFLAAALIAALSVQPAAASAKPEKASLKITASSDGKGVSGVEWSAWRVAEMPRDGEYVLTDAFSDSGLSVESLDGATSESMRKSAEKTVSFVKKNKIEADASAKTDKKGIAGMEELERGLYLLCQTGNKNDNLIVESQPFFVSLPMMKYDSGKIDWVYDVTARPKLEVTVPESPTESEPSTEPESPTESEPGTEPESPTESEPGTEPESPTESEPSTEPESPTESTPSTEPSTAAPNNPGSSGGNNHSHGGNGGGSGKNPGGNTITITDPQTPLASFVPPQSPEDDPELVVIEDEPTPLAGLPFVPKMGDMGTGAYAAGIVISFLLGGGALIRRRRYAGEEEKTNEQ